MSRQLEGDKEESDARRWRQIGRMADDGLIHELEGPGALVLGFSFKIQGYEVLLTIRALREGTRQVCFVGASSVGMCILKAARSARSGKLVWRADQYRT